MRINVRTLQKSLAVLRRGIQIACKKRPVSLGQIEALVNLISRWVQGSPDKEMAAIKIGQAVVKELKALESHPDGEGLGIS